MNHCPACETDHWREFLIADDMYTGAPYRILRCDRCGLAKTAGEEPHASAKAYVYGGSFDAGKRFGPMQWALRAFRNSRVSRIVAAKPGRALDVGCGDGSFLKALARQGWDVSGTELSESIATTACTDLGKRVRVGAVHEIGFPAASFDLVTFWHVLEHLEDPKHALAEASRLLKADGQIVVAVPNIDSWQARVFGSDWLHLDVPRHRWHFSPQTLSAIAGQCELRVECVRHFSLEYGPFAIVQGIATKVGLGHSLFTRVVRESLLRLIRDPLFWVHVPVLALTIIPSVLCELTAAICGRGGAVELVLRPK
jgi:SAM-dependent methyltransferase